MADSKLSNKNCVNGEGKMADNKIEGESEVWRKAISPVISVVLISSVLLLVLTMATFVSNNILELKVQNTEFEQAKTNMLLLNEVIEEAGLKYNSGSYVQFNLRSGALEIIENNDNMTISINGSQVATSRTLSIIYRAGKLVSSSNLNIKGSGSLIINASGSLDSLGYLRIRGDGEARIELDYNRIRIRQNIGAAVINGKEYDILEIMFFQIERKSGGGSGLLRVKAQNKGIFVESHVYDGNLIEVSAKLGSRNESYKYFSEKSGTVVVIIKSVIEVSAQGG
jgi:hypothetical protein